jgi:carbamoyltransferase
MIILGINHFYHDTSACILRDGQLVVALEEERFSRQKHTWAFPHQSIARALAAAGITPADVDHVAVSIDPLKDWHRKAAFALTLGRRVGPFVKHEVWRAWNRQQELHAWFRRTWPGPRRPRLHNVSHHLSHIAGSFFVSPFERAALLSMDGSGEWSTTWLGETDGRDFTCFSESYFPHSLGSFYEAATEFCGFKPNYDEGKTMGLAPFGDWRRFYDTMASMVSVDAQGRVHVDQSWFTYNNWGSGRLGPRYVEAFGPPRKAPGPFDDRHNDVAAAAQRVLEDRVLEMCRVLERRTTADYLVVSGGVALNSVMNGRILRETRFKDLYVMPAAGDNGTSIGAAYYVHNKVLGNADRHHHADPYTGLGYSNDEIEKLLTECKLPYVRSSQVTKDAARMLKDGLILGWFQGRSEIGPRALGNRSIICDPTLPHMKDKINAEVKHREAYRPFAPSAITEARKEFFEIEVEAPFMLNVCYVRPEKKSVLPAITHVDGTARLQTVRKEINPRYHELISEFGKLTGVPVILNTSFNIMGEPMVESPLQAIRCFYSTGLDVLVIGDFIVRK